MYEAVLSRHACVKDGVHDVVSHAKNRFLRPGSDIGGGVVELESLEPDTALLHYYCITSILAG